MKGQIQLVSQPQEYFREVLVSVLSSKKLKVQEEVEYYLVNLLFEFMNPDRLYIQDIETGFKREEPLVNLLQEALIESKPQIKKTLFRHIGDLSLYQAGLFHEHISQKKLTIDYYISIGERAYAFVEGLSEDSHVKKIFSELAQKFSLLVDIFSDLGEKIFQKTERDLIRTYQVWLETKNQKAERVLKEAGVLVQNVKRKKNHQ